MSAANTEKLHQEAGGLDQQPPASIAALLAGAQVEAAQSVHHAIPSLCTGALAMAETLRAGGTLYYVAAGSSGLMAAADAMELGGTFGIPASQIRILMAGGLPRDAEMPGDTEDASESLSRDMALLTARDTVIAVSASGTTPYTLTAAKLTKAAGATLIGIANNAGSALSRAADHDVLLPTPPEVLSGSTRMGAGTAQKIALNTLSTLMAVHLGHVHDGMMVNLRADNIKLRGRAMGIVQAVTGLPEASARDALDAAHGRVKQAILIGHGVKTAEAADALLNQTAGQLRPALARLSGET